MMDRRAHLKGLMVAGAGLLVPPTLADAEELTNYATFYVYSGTPPGCLAFEPDAGAIRQSGAEVVGYETIGMPETYEVMDVVAVDPPVPMIDWLISARFPRDAWGEPTFVRVHYR